MLFRMGGKCFFDERTGAAVVPLKGLGSVRTRAEAVLFFGVLALEAGLVLFCG